MGRTKVIANVVFTAIAIWMIGMTPMCPAIASEVSSTGWHFDGCDIAQTRSSLSPVPSNNLAWSYTLPDQTYSTVVEDNGYAVVNCVKDGKVYCFDAPSGTLKWTFNTGGLGSSSPGIWEGKVYVHARNNKRIYCLDLTSGTKIWEYATGKACCCVSSPVVANGKVYVGCCDNYVHCINATTGTLIWKYDTKNMVHSSPAILGNKVVIASYKLYCLNADSGSVIWMIANYSYTNSCIANNRVYVTTYSPNKILCLDISNGKEIWGYQFSDHLSKPTVFLNKVFVVTTSTSGYSNITCLSADTGTKIWEKNIGSIGTTGWYIASAGAGGNLYLGAGKKIYCLDVNNGSEIWTYWIGTDITSATSIASGLLYVSTGNKIYALGSYISQFTLVIIPCGIMVTITAIVLRRWKIW